MSLQAGVRLGPYEVVSLLGSGGMGEVYRARDTRLNRDVALKVLPRAFAADQDRLVRFEREAQVLAALNHPNIAHIHGLEDSGGSPALVMELVEGLTLAEWSPKPGAQGLPDDVLSIARQLADALAAAHARGIIHRDLKPANIKVTPAGVVKVLDFGLAKELGLNAAALDSAAMTVPGEHPLTLVGSVVGTLAYMSPEQARGETLDARSDLFSFGAVLYELATGRRAFDGAVATLIVDAVLHETPPAPRSINAAIPAALERVIQRLLEKDRSARYQSASEVGADFKQIALATESTQTAAVLQRGRRRQLAGVGVALAVVVVAGGWMWLRQARRPPASLGAYEQVTFFPDSATSPSFSPDGKLLTFIQGQDPFFGRGQVYVKAMPDGEPVQLTHDSFSKMAPVFSPDGSRIVYTTVEPPSRWDTWAVPALGGEPKLWMKNAATLSWTADKRVMFSEIIRGIHMRVVTASEARDNVRAVYTPAPELGMAHWSYLSPDGHSVGIVEMEKGVWMSCRVVPFDGASEGRRVGAGGQCTSAAWSRDGKWLYYSSNAGGAFHIWREPAAGGAPEQMTTGPTEEEGIAVAADGRSLLTSIGNRQKAIWMHEPRGDRAISKEGYAFVPTPPSSLVQPFSADGSKLFYLVRRGGRRVSAATDRDGNLWMTDVASGKSDAIMPGFNVVAFDVSRDLSQIVFAALDDNGASHLWISRLDRGLPPRQLSPIEADNPRFGANGEVFCRVSDAASGRGFIYRIGPDGGEAKKAIETPVQWFMSVSRDGAWLIASIPVESGALQTTLAFPTGSGSPVRLCSNCQADWTSDGRALLFRSQGDQALAPHTVLLALEPGRVLPRLPPNGVVSESDLVGLAVVATLDGFVFPLGSTTQYVSTRETIQRNIYRVPLPQ